MTQIEDLREAMQNCIACNLCHTRSKVVFGDGRTDASVMLVGEAPGEGEDHTGIPFVGKAGGKLDRMLSYVGLARPDIYTTNAVLCRPPNNRNPSPKELQECRWRLMEQIKLVRPELIVVLGKVAFEQLLGKPIKGALSKHFIRNEQDDWYKYTFDGGIIDLMITYHPSYHLRNPRHAYNTTLPHWTKLKQWVESNQLGTQVK